jgi:hypothetical protein
MPDVSLPTLAERADQALRRLAGLGGADDVIAAKGLIVELRNARQYELLGALAEAISRRDPSDPTVRRLYAQSLIETGKVTAAIDVLRPLLRLPKGHQERAEAAGLIGRAYKQIFFDAEDKSSTEAREALKAAITSYRGPFEEDPRRHTWHGVNLVAMVTRARRLGMRVAMDVKLDVVARRVIAELEKVPLADRELDPWYLPTLAEAHLGLGDLPRVEEILARYVDVRVQAPSFVLASTLRQFTQAWDLAGTGERGRGLVDLLRARVACASGEYGGVELTPEELIGLQGQEKPDEAQLQVVFGDGGFATYEWWETGRHRARSVASIRRKLGTRQGTGFLVRAGDLGLPEGDELVLLTNYHVVNGEGLYSGITPATAEVRFEAGAPGERFEVDSQILWSSPVAELDASILRLRTLPKDVSPLPISLELPPFPSSPPSEVFVIGHPAGNDLSFSFRGNKVLDHEGPPEGTPPVAARWRLHYETATKEGSSGSPVFNSRDWQVVALHHKGHTTQMDVLNGRVGKYGANEGIAMRSIAEATKAKTSD